MRLIALCRHMGCQGKPMLQAVQVPDWLLPAYSSGTAGEGARGLDLRAVRSRKRSLNGIGNHLGG